MSNNAVQLSVVLNPVQLGIPVKSNSGKLLGALSIAGPSIRMPDDRVDEFVGLLSNASMILSENETIFPTCSPYPIEV